MPETLADIHSRLRRLARRQRALLAAQACLAGAAAAAFAWAFVAALVSAGVATRAFGWWWVGMIGVATLVAMGTRVRGWTEAARLRAQATRLEHVIPSLRGALLAVLDRSARPLGSPVLVERMARDVVGAIAIPVEVAWPVAPVRRDARWTLAAFLSLVLAALALPSGPMDAIRYLLASASSTLAAGRPAAEGPRAVLGDISLRYLYPTYTRLEPVVVPNSSGDVHAPPGTVVEIRARTAERYESANLVAYADPPLAVTLVDGRQVATSLTVVGAGTWTLAFPGISSPDYAITPDPDLAPDVTLQTGAAKITIAADSTINGTFAIRDDYGVSRIVIEVKQGGKAREIPFLTPLDSPRSVQETLALDPTKLGLGAGDRATVRLGAWDNDAVSGSKVGWSAAVDVEVLGPSGRSARNLENYKRFRDTMLLLLADFVVEPTPIARARPEAAAWGALADARYRAFDSLAESALSGGSSASFLTTMVDRVVERRRGVIAFARMLGESEEPLKDADAATLARLQMEHVAALEDGVLLLDQLQRRAAIERVNELAKELAVESAELRTDLASLSEQEALARLDQIERQFRLLSAEAAKLDGGSIRDFIEDRGAQMKSLMDEVRKAISEGRMDDAKKMMDRLAQMMAEMAGGLEEMQKRSQAGEDKLGEAMQQLRRELATLQADQSALRDETRAARQKFGAGMDDAVKQWAEVERLANGIASGVNVKAGKFQTIQTLDPGFGAMEMDAANDANGLADSARARDLTAALERVDNLIYSLSRLDMRLKVIAKRKGESAVEAGGKALAELKHDAAAAAALLRAMHDQKTQSPPALQKQLQSLAQKQQQISDRADQMSAGAQDISRQLPMRAPGLAEGAQQAAEQAQRAEDAMGEGDAMGAEGAQRATEEGLQRARDALNQAQRDLRELQQQARGGGQDNEQKGGGGGDKPGFGDDTSPGSMQIPAPEEFQTPEEYRRALLDGMGGQVPEQYKASNRRYYEELVRQ